MEEMVKEHIENQKFDIEPNEFKIEDE